MLSSILTKEQKEGFIAANKYICHFAYVQPCDTFAHIHNGWDWTLRKFESTVSYELHTLSKLTAWGISKPNT